MEDTWKFAWAMLYRNGILLLASLLGIVTLYVSAVDGLQKVRHDRGFEGSFIQRLKSTIPTGISRKARWPHEKFGYTLYPRAQISPDRALSEFNQDLLYATACGSLLEEGQSVNMYKFSQGLAANTCLRCKNNGWNKNGNIQSCKVLVETSSSSELSYEFVVYTDTDCSTNNGSSVSVSTWDTGTCYDDSWQYSFLPGITDLSQLGNGLMYVYYQDPEESPCTSPIFETSLVGYYEDYCYCVTDDDDYNGDDDDPNGCVTLHYNGHSSVTVTTYYDYNSCKGSNVKNTYSNECTTDDAYNAAVRLTPFTDDDYYDVYENATSFNCYGLDPYGQNTLSVGAIIGIAVGCTAFCGIVIGASYYIYTKKKKEALSDQDLLAPLNEA